MQKIAKIIIFAGAALLYIVAVYDNWQFNAIAVRGTQGAYPFWVGVSSSAVNPLIGLGGIFLVPFVLNKGAITRSVIAIVMLPALFTYVGKSIQLVRNIIRAGGSIQWHWGDIKLVVITMLGAALVIFAYIMLFRASKTSPTLRSSGPAQKRAAP